MLPFLNRNPYIVRPKKKFVDWASMIDETFQPDDAVTLLAGNNIYLLEEPASGTAADAQLIFESHWREIAESEFNTWSTNREDWPQLASFQDFTEYFDHSPGELAFDLGSTRLSCG